MFSIRDDAAETVSPTDGPPMYLARFLLFCVSLLLAFGVSVQAQAKPLLLQNFEYRWGESPRGADLRFAWASPQQSEDGGWKKLPGPLQRPPNPPPGVREVWYRLTLPSESFHSPSLLIDYARDAADIFLDGKKIFRLNQPGSATSHSMKELGFISLPHGLAGKLLVIRAVSLPRPFVESVPFARLAQLGETGEIIQQIIEFDAQPLMIGVMAIVAGVILLVVFASGMRDVIFFWAGTLAFCMGTYIVTRTTIPQLLHVNPYILRRAEYISLFLSPAVGGTMVNLLFSSRIPRFLSGFTLFASSYLIFFALAAIVSTLLSNNYLVYFLYPFQLSFMPIAALYIFCVAWDSILRSIESRILLGGVFIIFVVTTVDVVSAIGVAEVRQGRTVSHWGVAGLLVAVILLLVRRSIDLYQKERRMAALLRGLLQTTHAFDRAGGSDEVLLRATEWLFEALRLDARTSAHVFRHDRTQSDTPILPQRLTGGSGAPKLPTAIQNPEHAPLLSEGTLWIPAHVENESLYLAIHPFNKSQLSNEELMVVQILAETLELKIAGQGAVEEMRQLHAKQLIEQRQRLVERLTMAAEISDKLNSPLLVLGNVAKLLKQRFDGLRHSEIKAIPQASQNLLVQWDKLAPYLDESIQNITTVSQRLSLLRDEAGNLEATQILQSTSGSRSKRDVE